MTHADIWNAIEFFAKNEGLTCSGLARKSHLDPTTFNKSKRLTSVGKERWPSMYSIHKMLNATNKKIDDFVKYLFFEKSY